MINLFLAIIIKILIKEGLKNQFIVGSTSFGNAGSRSMLRMEAFLASGRRVKSLKSKKVGAEKTLVVELLKRRWTKQWIKRDFTSLLTNK